MEKFTECLNDLMDYFILGDPVALSAFQKKHQLPNDLLTEFTTQDSGDLVVEQGVIIPLAGIENYPYTIYFNTEEEPSIFEGENDLQFHRKGYNLQVQSEKVYLFTMPYLRDWTKGQTLLQAHPTRPRLALANGWYTVEVLGGETNTEQGWEPTFEFRLKACDQPPTYQGDIYFQYKIMSREY